MGKRLSAKRLRTLLRYEHETGAFYWLVDKSNRINRGDRAGGVSGTTGYRYIGIDNYHWPAAKLAWLYVTGKLPNGILDHINRDRSDDRFCNLRLASVRQNAANTNMHRDNSSGFKGIEFHKPTGKWRGRICINGQRRSLGLFQHAQDAHEAYCRAAQEAFGEYAAGGSNR